MSTTTETSLTSMKDAFPAALDPIQGIYTLASLIDLMLYICRCSQTQKTPASATMNMVFCAASPGLYSFFTNDLTQEQQATSLLPMHRPPNCACNCTPHCPPSKRRQGAIYTHMHPRPTRSPSRCTSSPHHPRPSVPLPSLHCHHVQCGMHSDLH